MVYFGPNLKFIRKKKGINQSRLATMLNVRPNTISNYENGVSFPDFKSLEIIIKFFEVGVEELLYKDLRAAATGEELARYEAHEEAAPLAQEDPGEYKNGNGRREDPNFWIIMQQLKELHEQFAEVKELLKAKTESP
jgi:transcriptional regulator with XRE-family HTH domain